jgi:N utilization substance protein B
MPIGRRAARRQAVFILYQKDLLRLTPEAALRRQENGPVDEYAARLVEGVAARGDKIDALLQQHVAGWTLDRLGVLERSILRMAVYELLWEPDVPPAVAIDEAVALAKRFCSDEAGALVNGVLGAIAASLDVDSADARR